jgi:hypothetical protein
VTDLERLAGEEMALESLIVIIKDAFRCNYADRKEQWLASRLNKTLEQAFYRTRETPEHKRVIELMEYFGHYLRTRNQDARDMLEGAVLGVLETGLRLEEEAERRGVDAEHSTVGNTSG